MISQTINNIEIEKYINQIRSDFPILQTQVYGKPLIYFDNGATSQKPIQVIDRITKYYAEENANIHRGVYYLSQLSSDNYEQSRKFITQYLNAKSEKEIIFTRGATEGINLIASSFGKKFLKEGDEVLITYMEHHANIVPWQVVCEQYGAKLKAVPIQKDGTLDLEIFENYITEKTKIVSTVYVSNGIGTINPIKELIDISHKHHIPILVDACQAAPHFKINVQELDCDFLVFSGHKTYGPTGIGILYGKESFLEELPPYQTGGDMIKFVSIDKTEYNELPHKFEAGTPHISGAIGLAEALKYFDNLNYDLIQMHEHHLNDKLKFELSNIDGLTILGSSLNTIPLSSFVIEGCHPLDIGTMIDFEGVAIRTGNHCTQPLIHALGYQSTCRVSLAYYNTLEEIDEFISALKKVIQKLR